MSYASLMVHQNIDGTNDCRLQIAAELARRFNTRLIGIASSDPYPPAYGDGDFVAAVVEKLRMQIEGGLNQASERFHAAAKGMAREVEWRQAFTKPTDYVAQESRAADLIIVGMATKNAYLDPLGLLDPAELLIRVGRPILLVPPEVEWLYAKHVLVAWKDTREARRAVWDALPFLQAANDVSVVEIAEDGDLKAASHRVEDVATWLRGHGVAAGANAVKAAEQPFPVLERLASQNAADLIVAGGYGHSRLQEWVLGGLTRDLLAKARCCCLLAH